MMSATAAFVRRDYLRWSSYRLNALLQVGWIVLALVALLLVGRTLGGRTPDFLARYGSSYAGYLFTGIAFADGWVLGFNVPKVLREAQITGTLEMMLASRFSVVQLLLLSTAFPLLQSLGRLVLYGVLAVVVFGLWHGANVLAVVVMFVLAQLTLGCVGLISAAFTLVVKQGDPVVILYTILNLGLGGVAFPRDVLPSWVQPLALILPLTHALEGMRLALDGRTVIQIGPQLLAESCILAFCLPATYWALRWAVRRAKDDGSFLQY